MKTFETINNETIILANIAYVRKRFDPYAYHKTTYCVEFVGGGHLELDREDGERLLEEMKKEEKR